MRRIGATLCVVAMSAGCGDPFGRECEQDSARIGLDISVTQWADGSVDVEAQLIDEKEGGQILCPEYEITVNDEPMDEYDGFIDDAAYTARFEEADSLYVVRLETRDSPAIEATVMLPPALSITEPMEYAQWSRAEQNTIAWDPAGEGDLELTTWSGYSIWGDHRSCLTELSQSIPDTGSYVFGPDDLQLASPTGATACPVVLGLRRTAEGAYPEALAPGKITASRVRGVPVTTLQ
jgi:hypothetical protein